MQRRLLLTVASGVILATGTAVWSLACDKEAKATASAAASSHACTAEMAAKCTPEQAAACRAKNKASMATASARSCADKATATTAMMTASTKGSCAPGAKAAMMTANAKDCCAGKATATTTMKNGAACPHPNMGAMTADAHAACSGAKAAVTADASGACAHDGKVTAMAAGSGYSCGGKGVSGATAHNQNHADCDACAGLADCDGQLKASGALTQVVKLKNGLMYVYTVQEPGKVRAIQAAVAQRYHRLQALQAAGDKAKLCPECKTMRGAMASGKLSREMVTIEGGCMALVTSSDRAIVSRLHAMVEPVAGRVKI